jgi:hypothetical protein
MKSENRLTRDLALVKSAESNIMHGISEPKRRNALCKNYVDIHQEKPKTEKVKGIFEGVRYIVLFARYQIAIHRDGSNICTCKFFPQNTLQFPTNHWSSGYLNNEFGDFDESHFLSRGQAFRKCSQANKKLFRECHPVNEWGFVVEVGVPLTRGTFATANLLEGNQFGSLEWERQMPLRVVHPTMSEIAKHGKQLQRKD